MTLRHSSAFATVFLITLAVYIRTLCPTIYVGDSAEFITNMVTLGINHPTGYPLFNLLGRVIIILVSFLDPAFAGNLVPALCASLASAMLFSLLKLLTGRDPIAFVLALSYGFSSTLWARATSAEVYTLNSLFIIVTFLLAYRWHISGDSRNLLAASFITGMGLSQHITGALVVPPLMLFVLLHRPRLVFEYKFMLALLLLGVLGFSTYLYLPLRSLADPPVDWGNPETLEALYYHFFPPLQKGLFDVGQSQLQERFFWLLKQAFTREFWFFGSLALVGLVGFLKEWRTLLCLLLLIGINVPFTLFRLLPMHADFDAYFIPTYIAMALFMARGLILVVDFTEQRFPRLTTNTGGSGLTAGLLAIPIVILTANFYESDKSENYFGLDFGRNLYSVAGDSAIVFTIGDEQTFSGWYRKYVDRERPDITIIDKNLLGARWGGSHMYNRDLGLTINERLPSEAIARLIILEFIDSRPIYFTHRIPWDFLTQEYDVVHQGMLIRILPKGAPLEYQKTSYAYHPGWEKVFFDERCKLMVGFYTKEFIDNAQFWYNQKQYQAGQDELDQFFAFPYPPSEEDKVTASLLQGLLLVQRKEFQAALGYVDSALALAPTEWRAYEYRGNFHFMRNDSIQALSDWKRSLSFNPSNENLRRNVAFLTKLFEERKP